MDEEQCRRKSFLLIRYCDGTFRDGQGIKLQILDTADYEEFRNIKNSYYQGAYKSLRRQLNIYQKNSICSIML